MSVVEQTRKQLLRERRTTAIESFKALPTGVVCLSNAPAGEAEYSGQRHGMCPERGVVSTVDIITTPFRGNTLQKLTIPTPLLAFMSKSTFFIAGRCFDVIRLLLCLQIHSHCCSLL